jgi:hypothetical protein
MLEIILGLGRAGELLNPLGDLLAHKRSGLDHLGLKTGYGLGDDVA